MRVLLAQHSTPQHSAPQNRMPACADRLDVDVAAAAAASGDHEAN
jgi:hypothetical protein